MRELFGRLRANRSLGTSKFSAPPGPVSVELDDGPMERINSEPLRRIPIGSTVLDGLRENRLGTETQMSSSQQFFFCYHEVNASLYILEIEKHFNALFSVHDSAVSESRVMY